MNKQDQLTQVLAQLTVLSDIVRDLQEQDPPTQGTDPSPARQDTQLRCVGTTASGSQCKRSAITGTTRCHLHPRDTGTRESKPTQKTVAENTFVGKDAMRKGKGVDTTELAPALEAGITHVALHSNVGFAKINKALTQRHGWTITEQNGTFASREKTGRSVTLTHDVHGTYVHTHGKHVADADDQNWHRTFVKTA
jgi:hypothetical protein